MSPHNTILARYSARGKLKRPLFLTPVKAGFPSPAEDFIDTTLDLNELLIKRPSATYFVRVDGVSMVNAGIATGDILVVDKSLQPRHNDIVVAVVDGALTVKRFCVVKGKVQLIAESSEFNSEIIPEDELTVWGVVTSVVKQLKH